MNNAPGHIGLPSTSYVRRESVGIFDGWFNSVRETVGRVERYMPAAQGRSLNGYCI